MHLTHATLSMWLAAASAASASGAVSDWSNLGGNACANGLVAATGPDTPTQIWSSGPGSLIAWAPATEGERIFVVRQAAFVPNQVPNDSRVVCLDLASGATLWTFVCPYTSGDWTTVVYGASQGRVFVGRGGNGSSVSAPVYCLNSATGALLWVSPAEVATGAYDGVVFTAEGDPIFTSNLEVRRLDAATGATVWASARSCSVSGNCGPARDGDALYLDEVAPGGQVISRFDAATGQRLYSSPIMPGFLSQNAPFCAPGGLVFYQRSQNQASVDAMYAFRDTGTEFQLLWSHPTIYEYGARHAITPDGGVTMLSPAGHLQIRDQLTGVLRFESSAPVFNAAPISSMLAVDAAGKVFYGNSGFPGTLYSFDPDLAVRWSLAIPNLNQAGPVLAGDGSLLVAATNAIRRYWTSLGTTFCAAVPNSTGDIGRLSASGSVSAASNHLDLRATGLPPNTAGFFVTSATQNPTGTIPPGSQGRLCLAGSIGRYLGPGQVQNSGPAGTFRLSLDLTLTPVPVGTVSVMAGDTRSWQAWHRDVNPTLTSNFTAALAIQFTP